MNLVCLLVILTNMNICDEWFHNDCVNVVLDDIDDIDQFNWSCANCKAQNENDNNENNNN